MSDCRNLVGLDTLDTIVRNARPVPSEINRKRWIYRGFDGRCVGASAWWLSCTTNVVISTRGSALTAVVSVEYGLPATNVVISTRGSALPSAGNFG